MSNLTAGFIWFVLGLVVVMGAADAIVDTDASLIRWSIWIGALLLGLAGMGLGAYFLRRVE